MANEEDAFASRKGKIIAKLSSAYKDRPEIAESLFGIVPSDVSLEKAKEELEPRLGRVHNLLTRP